jgi:energy-coupling factor transporter ATP-binding protein EcfA2
MRILDTVAHGTGLKRPGVPKLGEHADIVGKNGSGKSTTATIILRTIKERGYDIFILDSKGERIFSAVADVDTGSPKEALAARGCVVYRPEKLLATQKYLDGILEALYNQRRSLYIYVDETYQLTDSPKPPQGLANILMRGRRRWDGNRAIEISVILGAQRPSRIPVSIFTEATHYYIHQLKPRDLETMYEEYVPKRQIIDNPPRGHHFYYYNEKTDYLSPLVQWKVSK